MPLPFPVDLEVLSALPLDQQQEALARLQRLETAAAANPLWSYVPHAKQREYHSIGAQVGAFVGGNRSGKSYGGTVDDIIQVVDVDCLPPWLMGLKRWHGEVHWRVITPNLKTTLKQVVLPLFKQLLPKDQLIKGSWSRSYNNEDRILTLANGNTIDFLTHEMELDAFSGAAKHGIRMDEEPKGAKGKQIFDESWARLISTGGDFRMTFTPLFGLSWSYYELTATSEASGRREVRTDEDVHVVTVDMDDNPHLDQKTKEAYLSRLSGPMRAARKSGLFVHFAGQIYPQWDPDLHVIPEQPIPRDQAGKPTVAIFNWIDPGVDHPTSVGWFWIDNEHPDGRLVVFDSFKVRGKNVAEVAAIIHEREQAGMFKPRWRVIDPSARNKQHVTGRSLQDEYRRHKIHTIPGQNSRTAGFDRVRQLLSAKVKDEDTGRLEPVPRLVVMANNSDDDELLPGLIEEFPLYRWRQRATQAGEGASPQEPIKVKDDHLDGLRYGAMSNPTGLRFEDAQDLPPTDPAKYAAWERSRRVRDHLDRLTRKSRRRGRANAGTVR